MSGEHINKKIDIKSSVFEEPLVHSHTDRNKMISEAVKEMASGECAGAVVAAQSTSLPGEIERIARASLSQRARYVVPLGRECSTDLYTTRQGRRQSNNNYTHHVVHKSCLPLISGELHSFNIPLIGSR